MAVTFISTGKFLNGYRDHAVVVVGPLVQIITHWGKTKVSHTYLGVHIFTNCRTQGKILRRGIKRHTLGKIDALWVKLKCRILG